MRTTLLVVVVALGMVASPAVARHGGKFRTCFGLPATVEDHDGEIYGTNNDDVLIGGRGPDQIYGFGGNDRICAGGGDDTVVIDVGGSSLPQSQRTYVDLGPGDDWMADTFTWTSLSVYGGSGDDFVVGSYGSDLIHGGPGRDAIIAKGDSDQAYGDAGNDQISVGTYEKPADSWTSVLDGGRGNDEIDGLVDDAIEGGPGIDLCRPWPSPNAIGCERLLP